MKRHAAGFTPTPKPLVLGFTLIELLVTMTIVSVVFLVGVSSFRDFSRRQVLSGTAKTVISDLRLIQQKALSGEKPDTCTTLSGYSFDINNSGSGYKLYAICQTNIEVDSIDDLVSKNITISSTADPINFKVLGQGTNLTSTATITLNATSIGKTQTITVGVGGNIK